VTPPQGVDSMPGSLLGPGAAARLAAAHPGSPAATKQISFQICWYLHYHSRSNQEYAWELFFSYLQREVFACLGLAAPLEPPQTWYPQH
jgi:hypothetical protein